MTDGGRSDLFDDAAAQLARLKERIAEVESLRPTLSRARQSEMGWWLYGARKHAWRLSDVVRAQAAGTHVFVIHARHGSAVWGLCSCGARIPGCLHDDYTREEFAAREGHVPFEQGA